MRSKSLATVLGLWAGAALAQAPLSAIDWLENRTPVAGMTPRATAPIRQEPPVSRGALPPTVDVVALDAPDVAAVGLLPSRVTGLPQDLWRASDARTLIHRMQTLDVTRHPALTSLIYTLMLAEAEPPRGAAQDRSFLLARVETLLELGAVEPAAALLERAGPEDRALFAVWFDVALLTDRANQACATLRRAPHLSQSVQIRVFCAARLADWPTAVTTLQTAQALGDIDDTHADLLMRFLDPELVEDVPPLPPPRSMDPMTFRLYEAIGERQPTARLPRRFAVADLGGDAGWKAQIEAAERLSRVGAVSENRLIGVYTDRDSAASGGVWDRVDGIQRLERALATGRADAVSDALNRVWPQMQQAGLAAPFAQLYGPRLLELQRTEQDDGTSAIIVLLSSSYEAAARLLPKGARQAQLLAAVATGDMPDPLPRDTMTRAVAMGFAPVALPDRLAPLVTQGRLGEAILAAMALYETGADGNPADLSDALMGLRALGLEDTARRAALHLLLVALQP